MVKLPALKPTAWYSLLVLTGMGLMVAGVALVSIPVAVILAGLALTGLGFVALGVQR